MLSDQIASMKTTCAWCNKEQQIPQGEGSHSICTRHAEKVELEYQTVKFDRVPSYVERHRERRER